MLNQKMLELGKKPSAIREIFEYSNARKAQIGADKVFDFSLGNPSIPAPEKVNETITELVKNKNSVSLHGYTSASGDIKTRCKIAENIKERFGVAADASLIYMTCGAAASLTVSLKAVCNEGDEVIVLAPYFPEYKVFISAAGAKTVEVPCRKSDFGIDVNEVEKHITDKTKAIIINSPNNPTGAVFSETDLKALCSVLKQKSAEFSNDIFILADEPYREIAYDGIKVPYIPCLYDNTIVCYSYSKSLSLPGERIGYIFVSPEISYSADVFAAVCGAGRSLGFVCAPSLMQYTVCECDGISSDIALYDKNRRLLYDSLTDMGYSAVHPDGAFYLFVKALEDDAAAFCERAKKYELLLVPSDSFGCKGYVRISYCVGYEQIKNSLPAFEKLYEEYRNVL